MAGEVNQRCGGDGCRGCAWCERESGVVMNPREAQMAMDYGFPREQVIVSPDVPNGKGIVGEFMHSGTEIARELAGCPPNAHHSSDGICVGHSPGELVGCAMEDIGAGGEGRILLGGPEGVRRRHPDAFAQSLRLTPYRGCCTSLEGSAHLPGCGTHYFAEGQEVIKPGCNPMDPWALARLRIREDTISSDRTFENETRLNPRKAEDWVF